ASAGTVTIGAIVGGLPGSRRCNPYAGKDRDYASHEMPAKRLVQQQGGNECRTDRVYRYRYGDSRWCRRLERKCPQVERQRAADAAKVGGCNPIHGAQFGKRRKTAMQP